MASTELYFKSSILSHHLSVALFNNLNRDLTFAEGFLLVHPLAHVPTAVVLGSVGDNSCYHPSLLLERISDGVSIT